MEFIDKGRIGVLPFAQPLFDHLLDLRSRDGGPTAPVLRVEPRFELRPARVPAAEVSPVRRGHAVRPVQP